MTNIINTNINNEYSTKKAIIWIVLIFIILLLKLILMI